MEQCRTCGADRHRVGVLYPARRLCACEQRSCAECKKETPAIIVEFQHPIKGSEPRLPSISGDDAVFLCAAHAPSDFPLAHEPAPKAQPKKAKGKPHIDPVWEAATAFAPPGSDSPVLVECAACRTSHKMKDRRMFNGTRSECPKCSDGMYTIAMEDAA